MELLPTVPQAISHYRVLAKLGKGGMGEVYLAQDTKLNRRVAIKVISAEWVGDGQARRRLIREAQSAAALEHPNICAVYEIGEEMGRDFIVMQYVQGVTLADRLRQGPLDVRETVRIAAQVVGAVAEAHTQGIIHRDIKPQNIMLDAQGRVKVLDFGLAKVAPEINSSEIVDGDTQSLLTEPGALIGTLPCMSPEQLRGDPLDGRTDIFSIGTTLYTMVSGRQPFARESPIATMTAILSFEPLPLAEHTADVPPRLDSIVNKCLAKDRERRYKSARELAADLDALRREIDSEPDAARVTRRVALIALAAVVVIGGVFYLRQWPGESSVQRDGKSVTRATTADPAGGRDAAEGRRINSVAVLPFITQVQNPDLAFLSKGLTQSLSHGLSQLPGMKVLGASALSRYEQQDADAKEAGRELNVEAVVKGQFTQRGDDLELLVEVVRMGDDGPPWRKSYRRKMSDILNVQAELTTELNEMLRAELSEDARRRLAAQQTDNKDAYKLYLLGRSAWSKRTPQDLLKSVELFNRAIDLDPTYALAYAGLSDAYSSLGAGLQVLPPQEAMPKAKAAAQKALDFDETLPDAHTSMAVAKMLYDWDWAGAEQHFRRALALNPNSSATHNWYSLFLIIMGRLEDSLNESRQAQELDPLSPFIEINRARTFYFAGQYDRTIESCNKVIEVNPKFYVAHYFLGLAYVKKGRPEKAVVEFKTVIALNGDAPLWTSLLGYAYASAGRRLAAQELIDRLKEQSSRRYVSPLNIATIYTGLGDRDEAFKWLERACQQREGVLVYIKVEPVYESLRDDPRFPELLHNIGLPQ